VITGQITADREAVLRLVVQGPSGSELEVDAVIDTGFTEFLTLPPAIIAGLGLTFRYSTPMVLADGSTALFEVYRARVEWDGSERTVLTHEADGGALVGMSLLYGSRVTMDVVDGGPLTIEQLP
jgi:clan AA aspartic protease